jgi:hypothetical protein
LAPEAQKFVDAIKALKPAFEELRLGVQNRLFAGLGTEITNLANAWLPQLEESLGSYADTFNGLFKNLSGTLQKPQVIEDLAAGAETVRANFEKIGKVVTGPLLEAFASLAAEAKPFLDAIGTSIADGLQRFADKINAMAEDGRLEKFFQDATGYFNDLKDIAKDVGSIIGSFFQILTGEEQSDQDNPFKQFKGFMDDLAASLKDPETQEKIRGYIQDFKDFATAVGDAVYWGGQIYDKLQLIGGLGKIANPVGTLGADLLSGLSMVDWSGIGTTVKEKAGEIGGAIWEGLKAGWEAVANVGSWIASKLWSGPDSLVGKVKSGLGIASPSTVFMSIGRDIIQGLMNGITARFGDLRARAGEIPGRVRDAVGNAAGTLVQKGRDFVSGVQSGISGMLGSLQSTASSMRSRVSNGLGSVGNLLYSAGRAIVSGLISGIGSMLGSLGSYLGGVATFIKNNKGPIEKDRRLLIPEGAAIMDGLIAGIASRRGLLGSELGGISDDIASSIVADPHGIYAQAELAFGGSFDAPAPAPLVVGLDRSSTGDWLMDGLRRNIQINYGGNVSTALGNGR